MSVELKGPGGILKVDAFQVLRSVFDVDKNCLRVCVVDGSPGSGGGIEVIIDHTEDSIRLGDGTNFFTSTNNSGKISLDVNVSNPFIIEDSGGDQLEVNADGSLNVSISGGKVVTATYNEITGVASGATITIASIVPGTNTALTRVTASGSNTAYYEVVVNGTVRAKKYTYFGGELSVDFDFSNGIPVVSGQTILVRVRHARPFVGNFNATIITEA